MSLAENPEVIEDINDAARAKLCAVVQEKPHFAAFVDGDLVDSGSNFITIAINASMARAQRGKGAQMAVYDLETGDTVSL